jgi:pyrroloquinoline quinone biosynthesis protein D
MAAITKRVENFAETDIDEEIIVMRLDNGELLSLPGTAATIWRLIDGSRDRLALLSALEAQFASDQPQIARDLDELLGELKEAGLIAVG